MVTEDFKNAYKKLNPEQKRAVDTIEGPVMVVAGPGTGKTQILTLRIANILAQTDTEPENILALTFTEAAAKNMRKRLAEMIGSDAYQVAINTFHGFANDVIQNYPEYFPHIIGAVPITEVESVQVVESILLENDFTLLKPFGDNFYYVRAIISAISELKREGVTPEKFADIIKREEKKFANTPDLYHEKGAHKGKMKGDYQKRQKQIDKNNELSKIYDLYQKSLREDKRYDFSDMILEVVGHLESEPELLQILQEEHQYILVDEHQDSNNAQNKILELLASYHAEYPNLFVVGDEKQSIFRFQGASLENFFYFKKQYPKAELVTLIRNYRSSQHILDASGSVLNSDILEAHSSHDNKPIDLAVFPDEDNEMYSIAKDIQSKIGAGAPHEEIAILYRNNNDAFGIARMFEKMGIPHQIESDQDLLSNVVVQQFIMLLRAVEEFGNDEYLSRIFHLELFDFSQLDIVKVTRGASQKRKKTMFDLIKDQNELKDLNLDRPETFIELYVNLESWSQYAKNNLLIDTLEEVFRASGLLQHIMSSDDVHDGMNAIMALFEEAKTISQSKHGAKLNDFFVHIDTIVEHNLRIRKSVRGGQSGYVRLMTAHRSKGLEFDYVYIVHAVAGKWGKVKRRELLPLLEGVYQLIEDKDKDGFIDGETIIHSDSDERRLFYVAMTRARKHIMISHAEIGRDEREQLPSPFLTEIREDLIDTVDTSGMVSDYEENRIQLFAEKVAHDKNKLTAEYIRDLFLSQPLSVSALNNYLRSPWEYFYRNLMRIPSKRNKHQAYGTAVHGAIDELFSVLREGEEPSKDFLLQKFEEHLKKEILSPADYNETLDKGYEALPVWFNQYKNSWNTNTLNEFRVNGVEFVLPSGDAIRLTGVLDKIEMINDTDVNVVDYKTGKPKTRNALMGGTKDANKNYFRQLAFYRLLLDEFKDGKYRMISGEIDFVEPDTKGKLHKEKFEISDDDVAELRDEIIAMADDVMNLKFWDTECDPNVCNYCDLVEILKKKG